MADLVIPFPADAIRAAEAQPSRTYALDLDRGRIVGMVDGIEAVQQAIRKAIITPRFKCLIYDDQYGSEIAEAVVANDATPEYIEAAIEGFVKDALKPDNRILETKNYAFRFNGDSAYISFDVDTIYGMITVEEVV